MQVSPKPMDDPVVVVMSVLERVLQGHHFGTPKRQRVVFKSDTKQAQTANMYYVLYDNCQQLDGILARLASEEKYRVSAVSFCLSMNPSSMFKSGGNVRDGCMNVHRPLY